jgi:hypothetical protein
VVLRNQIAVKNDALFTFIGKRDAGVRKPL